VTRRVIVTGASSGIGRAAALLLAEAGCEVVLAARRRSALEEVAAEIHAAGGSAEICVTDVALAEQCRQLVATARELPGEIYPVLVNAAGMADFGDSATMSIEAIEHQVQVNLMGPLYASHAFLPWALERGGGQIVNVLSITASLVFGGSLAYSTSKAGLLMAGKVLAAEYRRKGLKVTAILPGAVDTPIWEGKSFVPKREEMMPVSAVAEAIRDVVLMPRDRNVDELTIMPPKGVL